MLGLDVSIDELLPGRYTARIADQNSVVSLREAVPVDARFELIVDDGGHSMAQQQRTLQTYWPNVSPCGVFVMEDLHSSLQLSLHPEFNDSSVTTLDLFTGTSAASSFVNFTAVRAEATSIELYRNFRPIQPHWNDDGSTQVITAVIHKRCAL